MHTCQDGELPPAMVPAHGDEEEEDEEQATASLPAATAGSSRRGKAPGAGKAARALAGAGATLRAGRQLSVRCLGRVEWLHPAFHNEKHIWPVGFVAERMAATPASGGREALHVAEVLEAHDGSGPLFR